MDQRRGERTFERALALGLLYVGVYHPLQNSQQGMDDKSFRLSARGCIDKGNVVLAIRSLEPSRGTHPLLGVAKDMGFESLHFSTLQPLPFAPKVTVEYSYFTLLYFTVFVKPGARLEQDWSQVNKVGKNQNSRDLEWAISFRRPTSSHFHFHFHFHLHFPPSLSTYYIHTDATLAKQLKCLDS